MIEVDKVTDIFVYQPRAGSERNDLTIGKSYSAFSDDEIVYSSTGIYWILSNDFNNKVYVHESNLVKLNDFRNKKLKDIGI